MKNIIAVLLLFSQVAIAGLPPTTSKGSADSSDLVTFKYRFPNFTGTHTGATFSLGVNSIAGGGTGQTSATAAFNALAPATTKGDVLVYDGTNVVRIGVGANGTGIVADSAQTAGIKWSAVLTNPMTTGGDLLIGGASGVPARVANGSSGQVVMSNGGTSAETFATVPGNTTILKAPTTQFFTTGTTQTYTLPTSPSPLYLRVQAVGPGGGGGSGGTGGGGGSGGAAATTFGSAITANAGGGGGSSGSQIGGLGGTTTLTTSSTVLKVAAMTGGGGGGGAAQANQSGGGTGGNSFWGGGGTSNINSAGGAGSANTGGGGGGGSDVNGGAGPGGGGGAGGYVEAILTSPSSTYTYTVGGGGAGGTGGAANGGAGAAGYIVVTEYYQ